MIHEFLHRLAVDRGVEQPAGKRDQEVAITGDQLFKRHEICVVRLPAGLNAALAQLVDFLRRGPPGLVDQIVTQVIEIERGLRGFDIEQPPAINRIDTRRAQILRAFKDGFGHIERVVPQPGPAIMNQRNRAGHQRRCKRRARSARHPALPIRHEDQFTRCNQKTVHERAADLKVILTLVILAIGFAAGAISEQAGGTRPVRETRNLARGIDRSDHDEGRIKRAAEFHILGLGDAVIARRDHIDRAVAELFDLRLVEQIAPIVGQGVTRNAKRQVDNAGLGISDRDDAR